MMISVSEARTIIARHIPDLGSQRSNLADATGRVLCEPIISDRPLPPFDRAAMDGIAISETAITSGLREFKLSSVQAAGEAAKTLADPNQCIEIMTGAPLPNGCICVIPFEKITASAETYRLDSATKPLAWANVHRMAADCKQGSTLLKKGQRLTGPRCSIAASVGANSLLVKALPRISVICTGDELVGLSEAPAAHQIRECNSLPILEALRSIGLKDINVVTLKDDPSDIYKGLKSAIDSSDFVLTIGGVSKGKFDYVPKVLGDLKVEQHFHRIAQRPGKPLWFGTTESKKLVFGLPGNPISVLVTLHAYVLPALRAAMGITEPEENIVIGEPINFSKDMTYFCAVKTEDEGFNRRAYKLNNNGSGDFASLAESDGFIEMPANCNQLTAGDSARFYRW